MKAQFLRVAALPVSLRVVPVLLLPVLVAISMVAGHLQDPGALWRDPYHDRNSHVALGLGLALALRSGDLGGLLHDLALPSAWPPLHGILLGATMAVLGPDHRFAVLPSIAGWLLAVLGLWPLCRSVLKDPGAGDASGAIAVALAVGSPAFRLLGSDVMLEGLGAGLTVSVLWACLRQRWALPAVWALAGLGAGALVQGMGTRWLRLTPWFALLLGTALLASPDPLHTQAAAIRRPAAPRDLNVAAGWADVVPNPGGVLTLTSIGRTDLVAWTLRASCRCRVPILQPSLVSLPDRASALAALERTLAETPARSLIAVHLPAPYPLPGLLTKDPEALGSALDGALAHQNRFVMDRTVALSDEGARVEIWTTW